MKESISALFVTDVSVYLIKRQNYLKVFPGYYALPGGKIDDHEDLNLDLNMFKGIISDKLAAALVREVKEELNFDLISEFKKGKIVAIDLISEVVTPDFNPYRFKNYYVKICLTEMVNFDIDKNEIEYGEWGSPEELMVKYRTGEILAVPPLIKLLDKLKVNTLFKQKVDLNLNYSSATEVPMIESIYGIRQFLPLSNTFPPANRTNSFIIGDDDSCKILIDPSPKNIDELQKFYIAIDKIGFDKILLTHHHPDHYEFSNTIAKKYNVPMMMSEYTYNEIGQEYFNSISIEIVKEGDVLTKYLGENVNVYEIPGHDKGHIGLAPESLKWFLVGDLIQTIGTVSILEPEGDMAEYFESLNRVIKLRPKTIIPSHGIILGGVDKLLETLNHRLVREGQIAAFLEKGLKAEEMIDLIYPELGSNLRKYALGTIKSHIKKIRS